jgi:hypothetical protein
MEEERFLAPITASSTALQLSVAICHAEWRIMLRGHGSRVNFAAFSPDGKHTVTASSATDY